MSTRRTTRASSKAASSRGATPSITEGDIPATPRRATRRGAASTPLPSVGVRSSTAYGTNSTAKPSSIKGPQISDQISSVLSGILNTVPENRASEAEPTGAATGDTNGARQSRSETGRAGRGGRGARGGLSATVGLSEDRSFQQESFLFGEAGIESSSIEDPTDILDNIPEDEEPDSSIEALDDGAQREAIAMLAEARIERQAVSPAVVARDRFEQIISLLISFRDFITPWIRTHQGIAFAVTLFISSIWLMFQGAGSGMPVRWYGLDFAHNVGQFIPSTLAHPISYFNQNDVKDLQARMRSVEYDIIYLKKRSDLDNNAIAKLEKMLPDFVVCKKDKYGSLQIPSDFWHALQDKISSDATLSKPAKDVEIDGKRFAGSGISKRDIEQISQSSAAKVWNQFMDSNRAKVVSIIGDEFDSRFSQKLKESFKDDVLAPKSEFIELIRQNWADTQNEVKSEVNRLTKKLDVAITQIKKLEDGASMKKETAISKDEMKNIAKDHINSLLAPVQLEALSNANIGVNILQALRRLNHFSRGTGAVINPYLTSPNYVFPSMNTGTTKKVVAWLVSRPIPVPNPPEAAISKWEEHGDCWCSASTHANGFGPSLAVITGNYIYPAQVVVEHISQSGALEPGAAPKDMELLAYIEDRENYEDLREVSDFTFEKNPAEEQHIPDGFVRIGTWTYDSESLNHIQAFSLQINLESFNGGHQTQTNHLIVRAKNNWGGNAVPYTCFYRVRVLGNIAPPEAF